MPRTPLTYGAALLLAGCLPAAAWGAAWEKISWTAPAAGKKQPPGVNAIAVLGRENAYLATSDGRLLHWDGTRLKAVDHPAKVSPRKFVVNAPDDVWVFGDDALSLHYDGKGWTRVDNPLSRRKLSEGRLWGAGCATPDRCFAGNPGRAPDRSGTAGSGAMPEARWTRHASTACSSRRRTPAGWWGKASSPAGTARTGRKPT